MNQSGSVVQVNDYTPFGVSMYTPFTQTVNQRYKYNGKELERVNGLDMYDYGARLYDPPLATWHNMDELCEEHPELSPFVYCDDDPVNKVDPDGRDILPTLVSGWYYNGKAKKTDFKSTKTFVRAMELFGQTTYGNKLLGSFIPKGKAQYGVNGQGQYASYILQLTEANCTSETDQQDVLGGYDGNKVLGFFNISETGK